MNCKSSFHPASRAAHLGTRCWSQSTELAFPPARARTQSQPRSAPARRDWRHHRPSTQARSHRCRCLRCLGRQTLQSWSWRKRERERESERASQRQDDNQWRGLTNRLACSCSNWTLAWCQNSFQERGEDLHYLRMSQLERDGGCQYRAGGTQRGDIQ